MSLTSHCYNVKSDEWLRLKSLLDTLYWSNASSVNYTFFHFFSSTQMSSNMLLFWQPLPLIFLLAHVQAQSLKVPLYIGSMAPLSGKRSWWGAGITAAMQMAFEYINNRSDILPYYELRLLANDTRVRIARYFECLK